MTTYSSGVISNPTVRVVSILSLLTSVSPRKLGLVEISSRLNIAKSTCCLVLAELCAAGYLIQEHNTHRYGLGIKVCNYPEKPSPCELDTNRVMERVKVLHALLDKPTSVIQLSRRNAIVVQSIQPCSALAQLGLRRPYMAPFGAAFLLNADARELEYWIESALRYESRNSQASLRNALACRLDRVETQGYEVIYQWEQDVLEDEGTRKGRWIGDLFEMDARMNAYRRELLGHESLFVTGGEDELMPVSRIVVPLSSRSGQVSTCVEIWLNGRQINAGEAKAYANRVSDAF